jgi:UrcA family protein
MNAFTRLIPTLALAALIPGLAQASTANRGLYPDGPSKIVRFADLDLANPHDVEVLYRRIRSAAHLVCIDSSASWDGSRNRNWTECFNGTMEDAVRRVNRPMLTALHQQRTKPRVG